jgi:hypothetical protein
LEILEGESMNSNKKTRGKEKGEKAGLTGVAHPRILVHTSEFTRAEDMAQK